MSIGNLSVKVTADTSGLTSGMDKAAQAARAGMGDSSNAVDDFRSHLLRAATDLEMAARAMDKNMKAANDSISSSSQKAAESVGKVNESVNNIDGKSMGEKVGLAMGAGVAATAAGAKTVLNDVVDYVKTQLVIAGIALITGIAVGVVAAVYLVSKAVGTIAAMMNGTFYKSENIDALIASNKELLTLQNSLRMSSIEAGGLNEALKRLGVDKGDYVAVFTNASNAVRQNTDELDRLGVKYTDNNGKLLSSKEVLENVKKTLDTYTAGWDRNSAAAAIGMGSYEQINKALSVTDEQVEKSKARLDDYQLGISAGAQVMVAEYTQTMAEFNLENELMAQGMKRVYADAVMPLYTDMANAMKDGWPIIVQATRAGVAGVVAAFYGLKVSIYIVTESILATIQGLGAGLGGIGVAISQLSSGNVKGAVKAVVDGWIGSKNRIKEAGSNIAIQMAASDKAIALAAAADGRSASIDDSKLPPDSPGKTWKDADKKAKGAVDDEAKKVLQGKLAEQEAFISAEKNQLATRNTYLQYGYQLEYSNAQDYYSNKRKMLEVALAGQMEAYAKETAAATIYKAQADTLVKQQDAANILADIAKKRAAAQVDGVKALVDITLEQARAYREFDLATTQAIRSYDLSNKQAQFQIDILGKNSLEVAKLTAVKQIQLDLEQRLYDMRNKGLPEADIARATAAALQQKADAVALINASFEKQNTAVFGANEAFRKYGETSKNIGAQMESVFTGAFSKMEDALVSFVQTGKIDFKSLANSIIADLLRIQARAMITNAIGGGGFSGFLNSIFGGSSGGGGVLGDIITPDTMGILGFANGGDPPAGVASMVGERGPELFVPKQAGTIIPNDKLGGGSSPNISLTNNITVAGGIGAGEAYVAIQRALGENNKQWTETLKRQGVFA